jgi:hypothetical protein
MMRNKPSESKTPQQLAQAFITLFSGLYESKYGYSPQINRYTIKYPILDLLKDLSYTELLDLTEYYFTLETNHSILDLASNYTEIISLKKKIEEDVERRRQLRELTRIKVEKYRESYEQ